MKPARYYARGLLAALRCIAETVLMMVATVCALLGAGWSLANYPRISLIVIGAAILIFMTIYFADQIYKQEGKRP